MIDSLPPWLERRRAVYPKAIASTPEDGRNGMFVIDGPLGDKLACMVSDGANWSADGLPGEPWEHVSVTVMRRRRCPTWVEMETVKRTFWKPEETVVQLHVPVAQHLSLHEFCLHLWKPPYALMLPPPLTVAPVGEDDPVVGRTAVETASPEAHG